MKNIKSIILSFLTIIAITSQLFSNSPEGEDTKMFKVTAVPADYGSYTITPELPADSLLPEGSQITIKATPQSGYTLDCIYSTFKGGKWGTMSKEYYTPEYTITVDKDMWVGATFIDAKLVENINITRDVVYAKPGVKELKYDVYAPKDADDLPCIVIIHGGGWSSNIEDVMRGLALELTKGNQYVVFSIDYRWINTGDGDKEPNSMHNLIEDVFGAIAHIQEHAEEYGGNPELIGVTGDSAGGHLSASAAVFCSFIGDGGFGTTPGVYEFMPTYIPEAKNVDQVKKEITKAIKAAAPSYGVFDAPYFAPFLRQKDKAYWDAVSPIKNVPLAIERKVPHLLLRGKKDMLITDQMVRDYRDVLRSAGQTATYIQIDDVGHAFFDWKPDLRTRTTFHKFGVPYAAKMKLFFDMVFYE